MNAPETQMLSEIALKVGRLEVLQESNAKAIHDMASSVNRLVEKLDKSDDIARDADHRARSAQHQIDEIKLTMRWSIGVAISAAAVAVAAIGLLLKH